MSLLPSLQLIFGQLVLAVASAAGALSKVGVSSYLRTPLQNTEVGGLTNSLHVLGLAIDLVGDRAALTAIGSIWRSIGLDAVDEGDHLHLELDGTLLRKEQYLPLL